MRQRKEADVGSSPQLRINRQNARRLAINLTSARGRPDRFDLTEWRLNDDRVSTVRRGYLQRRQAALAKNGLTPGSRAQPYPTRKYTCQMALVRKATGPRY